MVNQQIDSIILKNDVVDLLCLVCHGKFIFLNPEKNIEFIIQYKIGEFLNGCNCDFLIYSCSTSTSNLTNQNYDTHRNFNSSLPNEL